MTPIRATLTLVTRIAAPLVDLLARCWLAQLFWMGGLHALMDWQAALGRASATAAMLAMSPNHVAMATTAAQLALPPLLVIGLATRLAALPLLALSLAQIGAGQDSALLWTLLTGWFVILGAGPLSLDAPIARGIYDSALPFAPSLGRLLAAAASVLRPVGLLLIRAGVALVLWRAGMAGSGAVPILPALLAAGLATRLAVLPLLAGTLMVSMHAASNDHLCWIVLLLLIAANGPGPLSLDALVALGLRRFWPGAPAQPDPWDASRHQVVIVGGGFAGVAAARALRNAPCAVTLVDRHNYHLFQPLLYQVATASLSPADIATPIRALFRDQPNCRVLLGEVTGVDPASRTIRLRDGDALRFDSLILATGARHGYFGRDDWEAFAPGLKTLDDATAIRRRVLLAFERAETETDPARRRALLTFGVIGGGPTGVELAGAIAELARHGLAREFRHINPAQTRVLLVQAGDRVLPTFPPRLSAAAAQALAALGVEVLLGGGVTAVTADALIIGSDTIPCANAFWAAGVAASPAAAWVGGAADRAGRAIVGADLTVPDHPEIFAVGDTASVNAWQGKPVPGLAPAAKQAGAYAARVIAARLAGRQPPPPFAYRHAGSLATIGRRAAVADFGRLHVSGATAWWLWGAVHVLFLAGARNRVVVAVQWFWAYLTFGRGIRLITGVEPPAPVRKPA